MHIHTEAIKYTSKSATQFRADAGHWGTKAQAHYTATAARRRSAGDRSALLLRGRRCSLALWGSADRRPATGPSGGAASAGPTSKVHTGGRWTFSIEPRSFVLDQSIGGDLGEPAPVRGIYLPAHSAPSRSSGTPARA